jgi:hypothetical protein
MYRITYGGKSLESSSSSPLADADPRGIILGVCLFARWRAADGLETEYLLQAWQSLLKDKVLQLMSGSDRS